MKTFTFFLSLYLIAQSAAAESLSYSEARKILPRAGGKPTIVVDASAVPAGDRAQLEGARQNIEDVLMTLGAAIPSYGAVAISPSEGLFVEWLNGVGRYHSAGAAQTAALSYCNSKRNSGSAPCEIVVVVAPRGAKADAALSLSDPANEALRGPYRKLSAPKAFAISDSTGNFGFDRGDGGRALDACARAGSGARDCRIVVAD